MSALVDLINRTRRDHVITIEREINIVHERGNSFISQREVRGSDDDMLAAARAALREDPDVLVLEEIRTGRADERRARSGGVRSPRHRRLLGAQRHRRRSIASSISTRPSTRRQVQLALADNLRGVVAQVLLPKTGGGRVAAREVLLNTPAVASVIAEGKTSQLPMAIEGGRRDGMVPLNDALVGSCRAASSTCAKPTGTSAIARTCRRAQAPGRRHVVRRTLRLDPTGDYRAAESQLTTVLRVLCVRSGGELVISVRRTARVPSTETPAPRLR